METVQNNLVDFGAAIAAVKQGKRIAREGWNGKGMFVFERPADLLSRDMVIAKVKSLPQSVKDYYESQGLAPEGLITFTSYLCMKDVKDNIVNGWLASQTDMLAEDWVVLD